MTKEVRKVLKDEEEGGTVKPLEAFGVYKTLRPSLTKRLRESRN